MKKVIRLFGTTLLVTGMGIGGSALAAGAASADTGTQSATAAATGLQVTGNSWSNGDHCWGTDSRWNRDNCRDGHGDHGHHGDHGDHGHWKGN
jgi:hypothetical protein